MVLKFKEIDIHYTSKGKGNAVILLHGFLEDISMWNTIVPELSKTHRIITIDLLGHGKTPCLGYVHTMKDQAMMVHAVLKHLRLQKYILIGHSMGGYIALAYAKLFIKNIKGLCLLNSTPYNDNDELKLLRAKANKMVQNNYTSMVQMSFTNLFSVASRKLYKSELQSALKTALKTPVQGYIAAQEGMRIRKDLSNFFAKATFTKTFILGKKDAVLDINSILEYANKYNISTTVFSEGHMSHIENKIALTNALIAFLKKC